MLINKETVEPCTYLLDIEVDADTVRKAFNRAYRDFAQVTRVPGFRPGHAPRKVLENYVDDEKLRTHVMEILAGKAYAEALEKEHIEPYNEPDFKPGDLVEGEPWRFQVTVAGQPQVTLGDYSGIAVERPVMPISDDDVERSVETVRRDNAELKMVQGRAVQPNDVLIVDMSITFEGEPPGKVQRSLVRLSQTIPGFAEAVEGQCAEETRTFTLTFPPDYQDEQRAGKTAEFTVTVVTIHEYAVPEVTDAWVATLGPYTTVDEWKASLRQDLERQARAIADDAASSRIVKALVERATIEFPPAMVEAEVESDLARLEEELRRSRLTYNDYLEMMKLTREEHLARVEEQAKEAIRARLVLRAFAKQEGLAIDDAELERRYTEIRDGAEAAGVLLAGTEADQRTRIANRMLQEMLRERLFAIATITDVPAPYARVSEGE
jgi:trigger factor